MWRKLDTSGRPIIADPQNEDSGEPSAEDAASNELDRLARRETIRKQIAELELKLQRAELLAVEIARIDSEIDQAADLHASTCEPLQQEIERLESTAIERIAKREPPDAAEDARRASIVAEITDANKTLEIIVERCKKLKEPLERDRGRLTLEAAGIQAQRNKLTSFGVASPQLLADHHTARRRLDFAAARLSAANKAISIVQMNIAMILRGEMSGPIAFQRHLRDCWLAGIKAAQNEQTDAHDAAMQIHRQIVNE